jgi:hypothetical protein
MRRCSNYLERDYRELPRKLSDAVRTDLSELRGIATPVTFGIVRACGQRKPNAAAYALLGVTSWELLDTCSGRGRYADSSGVSVAIWLE